MNDLDQSLEAVLALRPVSFDWRAEVRPRSDRARQIGFVAQEVRALVPEVVMEDADGLLAMDYGRLTPVLSGAVQELHARLEAQDTTIADQQAEIDQLNARLATVEDALSRLMKQQKGAR